jgi:DUF4097 and DUF4098 domain-containing protein YvlB
MYRFALLCACLVSMNLQAWNDCDYEETIEQTLDLAGTQQLLINAAAGELKVTGSSDSRTAKINGRVCASEEEWLEDSRIETQGGKNAEINVELPTSSGWSWGNNYVYMDLVVEVPDDILLEINDSSGDMEISGVGAVSVRDSSGEIEIENSAGPVSVQDSSGDIEITDIRGDVTIESDSSGDIRGRDIEGSVLVANDSSGDIRFRDVGENFVVEHDSSGDISATGVGGDFEVMRDGSGSIDASNVTGQVKKPDDHS